MIGTPTTRGLAYGLGFVGLVAATQHARRTDEPSPGQVTLREFAATASTPVAIGAGVLTASSLILATGPFAQPGNGSVVAGVALGAATLATAYGVHQLYEALRDH